MNIMIFLLLFFIIPLSHAKPETPAEEVRSPERYISFGTIVPITGKYSELGEMTLRGIRTAIEKVGKFRNYKVFAKDSMSTEAGAFYAYKQIVEEVDPLFIIGPVPSHHVKMIENTNSTINKPVVIFPVVQNKAHRKNIISFYLPVSKQVKSLADYSLRDLKLTKFAVLSPRSGVGNSFSDSFTTYIKRNGGRIVYKGCYNTDLSDLDTHIKWLESYKIDAIFIPDSAMNSSLVIKKIISDDDITNVIFLGPNTWNSEIFYTLSRDDFDGIVHKIVFTDYINRESEDWISFHNIYRTLFNEKPNSYEYQVYLATLYFLQKDLSKKVATGNILLTPKANILTIDKGRVLRLR